MPERVYEYWDPNATRAWLVFKSNDKSLPMEKASEPGFWRLETEGGAGEAYSFVAEWVQEFRHCGRFSAFGAPQPEAEEVGLQPKDLPCAESTDPEADAAASSVGAGSEAAMAKAEDTEQEEASTQEKSDSERMGLSEFLLEAIDNLAVAVTDGCGVRLSLLVAPRVVIAGAQVVAVDGSWGPLSLRKVKVEGEALPSKWIGDAVDCSTDGGAEFTLRVHRRDWRADPNAHYLEQEEGLGWAGYFDGLPPDEVAAPLGPNVWSRRSAKSLPSTVSFQRCADRELVLYELHLGSFTSSGTLKEASAKLTHVRDLGCTAISLMPVQQDARRMVTGEADRWGYDVISFAAVDTCYGTLEELAEFVRVAHMLGLAVILDFVFNHMMWGAPFLYGPQLFLEEETVWGPRPDFSKAQVKRFILAAAELLLLSIGADGLRIDSTKSIRKLPAGGPDTHGCELLAELAALCRQHGKLAIAEDLEDGDGLLQWGGLGLHLQWDMALFCWIYDALVHPLDEFRGIHKVVQGLVGLAPGRSHALRGRVVFMESHDTAACDRYGRVPAAVHHGKPFMVEAEGEGGDAFQQAGAALPYPDEEEVTENPFAARRAALGLVLVMTAPGIPMLLQGQEVCECRPFKWPQGPALDWSRVQDATGNAATWLQLCRDLTALRTGKSSTHVTELGPAPPLQGDGVHVFHEHGGVLAYLRWSEAEDSRDRRHVRARLALVVVNWRNTVRESYQLGVPPSKSWRLALSVPELEGAQSEVEVNSHTPTHSFPCSVSITLQAYSAVILLQES